MANIAAPNLLPDLFGDSNDPFMAITDPVTTPGLRDIGITKSQIGNSNGLKFVVLSLVVEEKYEEAERELVLYLNSQTDFPKFQFRTQRYSKHAIDLINAIKLKRKIPSQVTLRQAKKQELVDSVRAHFEEIKLILQQIEKTEIELKIEDARSTVWVLQSLHFWLSVVAVSYVALDLWQNGLVPSTVTVVSTALDKVTDWFLAFF